MMCKIFEYKKMLKILLIKIFNILPIKKNKIFFLSYYGAQYGCNPKYISEYFTEKNKNGKFDLVWGFDNTELRNIEGIRQVKISTVKYFYELCTSRVIISNFRSTDLFIKRREQYYIQTWHSSLRLKKIEKDVEEVLSKNYIKMAKNDSKKIDLLISGCKYSSEIFKRAFWYKGEILEIGTPRNDIFFENSKFIEKKVKKELNIEDNYKIILYAPTFRKSNSINVYNLDYEKLISNIKNRFGGDWKLLIKLHPHLINEKILIPASNNIFDVTNYDDIQELLCTADVLISDYSSLIFDYAITRRPCFLYMPDIHDYIKNDRGIYFDIEKLPFVNAISNSELEEKINKFNYNLYKKNLDIFSKQINTFENGNACKKIVSIIKQICEK